MRKSTLKKAFAFMLAFVLVFAMSVPAFAATKGDGNNDYTITITPGDYTDVSKTDRYKAYEVFTGDLTADPQEGTLTEDEKNQLSNIKWGADVNVTTLVTALTKEGNAFSNKFAAITTISDKDLQAATVAKILDDNKNTEGFAKAFAIAVKASLKTVCTEDDAATDTTKSHPVSSTYDGEKFSISLDKSGYYLVVDEPSNTPAVGKGDIISEHILQVVRDRELKVKSATPTVDKDIVTGNGGYEIGQTIKFQLVGTLAENYKNFTGDYQYKFIDTMSKGLTLKQDSITVEVWSVKEEDSKLDKKVESITLTKGTTAENGNYTVNTTENNGTTITIAFDNLKEITDLLASYVIVVTYEAYIDSDTVIGTPETNAVKLEFSNDPYTNSSTTETPEYKVAVETLELDVVKKDAVSKNPLTGVKFKLYKEVKVEGQGTGTTKKQYGVFDNNAGTYTLKETANWNDSGTELVTVDGGVLKIKGLGEGTYYLEEVETPSGYNALPGAIEIKIECTYYTATDTEVTGNNKIEGELKTVNATFKINGETSTLVYQGTDASNTLGIIPIEILNVPISSLPGTGGIGNYIFYIGGGLLIVAAVAILLVSKKKASKEA